MDTPSLPRKLLPLMALACAPNAVLSPVQMQKALFLMTKRTGGGIGDELYEFIPHNYGPFSAQIYRDIDALAEEGQADFVPNQFCTWNSYGLTEDGRKEAEKALASLDPQVKNFLHSVVEWVTDRDFPELLRAVYDAYPEYATNSVFRGRS